MNENVQKRKQRPWNRKQTGFYRVVGERIRQARQSRNITQEALAHQVGMTRTSMTNIEKGRQKLLLHTLVELAGILKVVPSQLMPDRNDGGI